MSTPVVAGSPIGGQFISSYNGVPAFLPFQGVKCHSTNGGGIAANPSGQLFLDVLNAKLIIASTVKSYTHSGSYGRRGRNKTAEDWMCSCDLTWDLRKPPDLISKNASTTGQLNWDAGFQFWFFLGDDANYPSDIGAQFYYSPSAKIVSQVTLMDANGEEDIGFHFEIGGNSGIFKMPAEIPELDDYLNHCSSRNYYF